MKSEVYIIDPNNIPSIKYPVFLKIRLLNLIIYILQQSQFTHKFEQTIIGLKVLAQNISVAMEGDNKFSRKLCGL